MPMLPTHHDMVQRRKPQLRSADNCAKTAGFASPASVTGPSSSSTAEDEKAAPAAGASITPPAMVMIAPKPAPTLSASAQLPQTNYAEATASASPVSVAAPSSSRAEGKAEPAAGASTLPPMMIAPEPATKPAPAVNPSAPAPTHTGVAPIIWGTKSQHASSPNNIPVQAPGAPLLLALCCPPPLPNKIFHRKEKTIDDDKEAASAVVVSQPSSPNTVSKVAATAAGSSSKAYTKATIINSKLCFPMDTLDTNMTTNTNYNSKEPMAKQLPLSVGTLIKRSSSNHDYTASRSPARAVSHPMLEATPMDNEATDHMDLFPNESVKKSRSISISSSNDIKSTYTPFFFDNNGEAVVLEPILLQRKLVAAANQHPSSKQNEVVMTSCMEQEKHTAIDDATTTNNAPEVYTTDFANVLADLACGLFE
jgi:hypothetical protein